MEIILVTLIVFTGILGGYTANFQKTTLTIGKKLAPDNEFLPRGMQDAITPVSQNIRNYLLFILYISVLILCFFITEWYFAILILFGILLLVSPFFRVFMPKPESKHYLNIIKKRLEKKLVIYELKNDIAGIEAATFVLEELNKISK